MAKLRACDPNPFSFNKILERLTQTWDGTTWLNQTVYHFTYDIQDSCTESLLSIWDSGSWLDGSKSITIYYSYFPLSYYSAGSVL